MIHNNRAYAHDRRLGRFTGRASWISKAALLTLAISLLFAGCAHDPERIPVPGHRFTRLFSGDRHLVKGVMKEMTPTAVEGRLIMSAAYFYALSSDPEVVYLSIECVQHLGGFPEVAAEIALQGLLQNPNDRLAVFLAMEASRSDDEGRFTTDLGPSMLAAYSQLDSAGRSHVAVFFLDAEQRGHHRLRDLEARGLSVPTGLRQLMTQISNGSYTGD